MDFTHAPRLPEARAVRSTIVVGQDTGSRTIFYEADGMIGAHPSLPDDEVIRGAKVLLVDHYGMAGGTNRPRGGGAGGGGFRSRGGAAL